VLHFAHVDDVARANLATAGRKELLGQIYNIAGSEAITINGYIDVIAKAVGVQAVKVNIEPQVVRSLKRPIFFYPWERSVIYDIGKAKRDFGYHPLSGMREGMKQTYDWWLRARGIQDTRFSPGKLGYDVDLSYEDEVLAQYG
jgi:nucleoside-diphosphate-sugar epimerase